MKKLAIAALETLVVGAIFLVMLLVPFIYLNY